MQRTFDQRHYHQFLKKCSWCYKAWIVPVRFSSVRRSCSWDGTTIAFLKFLGDSNRPLHTGVASVRKGFGALCSECVALRDHIRIRETRRDSLLLMAALQTPRWSVPVTPRYLLRSQSARLLLIMRDKRYLALRWTKCQGSEEDRITRSFMVVHPTKCFSGDQITKNETGGAWGTYGR